MRYGGGLSPLDGNNGGSFVGRRRRFVGVGGEREKQRERGRRKDWETVALGGGDGVRGW